VRFEKDAAGNLLVVVGRAEVNLDNRVEVWVDVYHRKACQPHTFQ